LHIPVEALISVRLSGICGTDLEMLLGYYPFSGELGHEFVGEGLSVIESDKSLHQY
jgi:threonine dehydrogenase-like Zn-dependent dehydrogenase